MKKLRLLLTEKCNRKCKGCCNKEFELDNLPVCTDYTPYDLIMLTGGEPMLFPSLIAETITNIRKESKAPLILYTAHTSNWLSLCILLPFLDGITVTLHEPKDVDPFLELDKHINNAAKKKKSLRLNIFKEANFDPSKLKGWIIKNNIEWIPNCPLPENEIFMRYRKVT